jgi:hypothetical protein
MAARGLSNRAIAARLFVTPAPSRLTPSRSSPSWTSTRGRIHTAELAVLSPLRS